VAEPLIMSSIVPRISWHQLGRIAAPGRYKLMFGWVTVTLEDMAIWAGHPEATFALYETASEDGTEYRLGSVNLNSPLTGAVAAPVRCC
jgi:hypothetical protein